MQIFVFSHGMFPERTISNLQFQISRIVILRSKNCRFSSALPLNNLSKVHVVLSPSIFSFHEACNKQSSKLLTGKTWESEKIDAKLRNKPGKWAIIKNYCVLFPSFAHKKKQQKPEIIRLFCFDPPVLWMVGSSAKNAYGSTVNFRGDLEQFKVSNFLRLWHSFFLLSESDKLVLFRCFSSIWISNLIRWLLNAFECLFVFGSRSLVNWSVVI